MALLAVILIGSATYSHASTGLWIIGLVLFWAWIAFVLSLMIPATYERGNPQAQFTWVASFLTIFATWFTVEFVGLLAAHVLLGATSREVQELLEFLSVPLGWFSSQFVITPQVRFLDVCGIVLGNSFFIAMPVFVCAKTTQYVMNRNRVVQLGIDHKLGDADDEQD